MNTPRIVFVPGMKPKPPAEVHRKALWRCLLAGVGKADPEVAAELADAPQVLERASWTWAFYGRYRDINIDLPGIDALLAQPEPSPRDLAEAGSFANRLRRFAFLAADAVPFVVDSLARGDMRVTLRDVARYVTNRDGIGDTVRADLAARLASTVAAPTLVVGHSLGSVIAWDTLWSLTHERPLQGLSVDFMTLGSPLGNRLIQRGLKGWQCKGAARYPATVARWVNLVAEGELTALDRRMANDYREMVSLGLVSQIIDLQVHNHYRERGRLHVHSEYGYLANRVTGDLIARWWRNREW